ncbi:oxidoreductase [Cnuibacter physcomitrellae]|uniref:Oxidoreductase n=1 Tax=Cnuibacter physcomitrellae TaxID=1619308 RepID=A0A1X9LRB6_9MICO|nr:SDR family NAD(P)-dependent oxidoreductase [Cnuibacter physcomitrellae]ARJ06972.1 oxidoreductase [Cnuibacter physcomitrellae]
MSTADAVAGRTIVITGASSGFGRGSAVELAARGAQVVVAARRGDALEALVAGIEADGGSAEAVHADVSRREDVERIAASAERRFGDIDVWINNAGVGGLGLFWEIPVEDQARIVDVNLKGVLYGSHVALQRFTARGRGVLVNVGSVDSEVPLAYQSTYAATKAAVLSLGRSLEEELRLAGLDEVKVATVMPYAIDTPWWTHAANYTGHAPRMAMMDDPQLVVDEIVKACTRPRTQMPVGPKARGATASHRFLPGATERLTGQLVEREVERASASPTGPGAIYEPMAGTLGVDGGIRARMRAEDASEAGRSPAASE